MQQGKGSENSELGKF